MHIKKLLPIILGLILIVSPVYGVSNLAITPSNPKVGDTVVITGKANPNEEINCHIWFEINPFISPPEYRYVMNNVEIPTTPNNFKIVADNIIMLCVSLKMAIWITKNKMANENGVAVISKSNIPKGTYDIKIGGTIKDPEKPVKLKIIASTKIKADKNGNFKYSYKINNIPEGTVIHLDIGGVKRDILIEGSIPAPPLMDSPEDTSNNNMDISKDTLNNTNKPNNNSKVIVNPIKVINTSDNNGDVSEDTSNSNTNEANNNSQVVVRVSPPLNNQKSTANNKSPKPLNKENVIDDTIIKNIKSAILTIHYGTKISKRGDISIKEVNISNAALAYYIFPKDAEFSKPLTLEVFYNLSDDKSIAVLCYDNNVEKWVNIPYIYDKNNSKIIVKVSKSGYYVVKENSKYVENINNDGISDKLYPTLGLIKIVITAILSYLQNIF